MERIPPRRRRIDVPINDPKMPFVAPMEPDSDKMLGLAGVAAVNQGSADRLG